MPYVDPDNKKQYTADGIQTTFPFDRQFFAAADLQVYVGATLKTITTDYSVVGIGSSFENGGNVVFATAPAAGSFITIVRVLTLEQTSDYKDYANFPNEQFNHDLDRQMMVSQQLQEQIDRIGTVPVTDPVAAGPLPSLSERASKFAAWDPLGRWTAPPGMFAIPVTILMQSLLDDLTVEAAQKTLALIPSGASAEISAFIKSLLDDPDMEAARLTLGVF